MPGKKRYPLTFHDETVFPVLETVAEAREISVNRLIERLIARGLAVEAREVEADLTETLTLLRDYSRPLEEDLEAFAQAEGQLSEDPIQAERVDLSADPLGIKSLFA